MYMRIRHAREEAGLTREKFAELLNVSVSYLAELERGRTGISVKMLVKICDVLGLSADYILFGEDSTGSDRLVSKLKRVKPKYIPLIDKMISELLIIGSDNNNEP